MALDLIQDEMVAHFGLGQRTQVDRIEIRWPSGYVDVLTNLPADRKIWVIEGRGGYHTVHPTVWEHSLPDTVVVGWTIPFQATVRPALFEAGAKMTNVTVDLSEVGGAGRGTVGSGRGWHVSTEYAPCRGGSVAAPKGGCPS